MVFTQIVKRWLSQIAEPTWVWRGFAGYRRYFADWRRYARLPHAEPLAWRESYPQVHDRTAVTPFDAHYFYANGWALRRILAARPRAHVDVGSQVMFANLLAATLPVIFVDYRPLDTHLPGLHPLGGDLTRLPFADQTLHSLSCLHVVEHVGLGRYGDALNPAGTRAACAELARVLAPGGNLFLATPVGRERVCFNAHRVHTAEHICALIPGLRLVEFSGVDDTGAYLENISLAALPPSEYACGLFWFRRAESDANT